MTRLQHESGRTNQRPLPLRRQNEPLRVHDHGQVPLCGNGIASWAPSRGTQKEPDLDQPCAQEPPGPGGIGCGRGCASESDGNSRAAMATVGFIISRRYDA
jgi:hypothetical protein